MLALGVSLLGHVQAQPTDLGLNCPSDTAITINSDSVCLWGRLTQGALVRGQVAAGSQVWLNDQAVEITPQGYFAIGFGRDAPLTQRLTWQLPQQDKQQLSFELSARDYRIQRISGIAKKIMQPDPQDIARAQLDSQQVKQARAIKSQHEAFIADFAWPLQGRISGVYGSQRVYNGEPGRPHFGIDIAAPRGTDVMAPAAGVVTLAVPDMFYSGGTLIIDHGFGVNSTFLHLHTLKAKVGQQVKQGEVVAEVGSTGRSTGPHLDWRVNWFEVRLDPATLVAPMASK
ncbi:M23 family metallopeptidase [Shewanella sp. NIFS-20-20]|nr:M23 family metallopeptidase [Shewanella sp. NIFS-20-20]MBV7317113.1 M23 family metallopeptidase [Shewanella sp. NIFS-20-20]